MLVLTHGLRRALRLGQARPRCGPLAITGLYRPEASFFSDQPVGSTPQSEQDVTQVPEAPIVRWPVYTLVKKKLTPDDYMDISDARVLVVHPEEPTSAAQQDTGLPFITHGYQKTGVKPLHAPFPPDTRGFFFYQPHPKYPLAGSIRFRVMQQPEPRDFWNGHDLRTVYGTIWKLPVLAVLIFERFYLLRESLIKDRYLPPDVHERYAEVLKSARRASVHPQAQVITGFGDSFYVDLSLRDQYIHVLARNTVDACFADSSLASGIRTARMRKVLSPVHRWNTVVQDATAMERGVISREHMRATTEEDEPTQGEAMFREDATTEDTATQVDAMLEGCVTVDLPIEPGGLLRIDGMPVKLSRISRAHVSVSRLLLGQDLVKRKLGGLMQELRRADNHAALPMNDDVLHERTLGRSLWSLSYETPAGVWTCRRCLQGSAIDKPTHDSDVSRRLSPYDRPQKQTRTIDPAWQPPDIEVGLGRLRPTHLTRDDFVDLSDGRAVLRPVAQPDSSENETLTWIAYSRRICNSPSGRSVARLEPFPVNTRGFFYYRHNQAVPEASSIRFHVSPTGNPRIHGHGELDLQTEYGTPWQIPLIAIATEPRLVHLRRTMERQKIVPQPVWDKCEALVKTHPKSSLGPASQVVCALGEPFYVNLRYPDGGCGVLRCSLRNFGTEPHGSVGVLVHRVVEPIVERARKEKRVMFVREPLPGRFLRWEDGKRVVPLSRRDGNGPHVKKSLVRRNDAKREASAQNAQARVRRKAAENSYSTQTSLYRAPSRRVQDASERLSQWHTSWGITRSSIWTCKRGVQTITGNTVGASGSGAEAAAGSSWEYLPQYRKPTGLVPVYDTDWLPPTINIRLRTLHPRRLSHASFIDLSDSRALINDGDDDPFLSEDAAEGSTPPNVLVYGRRIETTADNTRIIRLTPFPVNTRGYFYCRHHPFAREASSLRFHVAPTGDPRMPGHGPWLDLQTEYGTPWQIPLLAIANQPGLAHVRRAIEHQQLVPARVWEKCTALAQTMPRNPVGALTQVVAGPGEPFYVDLRSPDGMVVLLGGRCLHPWRVKEAFMRYHTGQLGKAKNWPFLSGILRCTFKVLPQGKGRVIGLFVERVIEPVREKQSQNETPYVQTPQARQLLRAPNGSTVAMLMRDLPSVRNVRNSFFRRFDLHRRGPGRPSTARIIDGSLKKTEGE
ncbi:hypothetical protein C8Q77DRAFT_1071897 [Trametes polyzona]|nr:hypothetical protein C8Q77DRAFT_1071897 [Trametes polyzona]